MSNLYPILEEIDDFELTVDNLNQLGQEVVKEVQDWKNNSNFLKLAQDFYQGSSLSQEIRDFLSDNLSLPKKILNQEFDYLNSLNLEEAFTGKTQKVDQNRYQANFLVEMILERFYLRLKNLLPDQINDPKDCPWSWNDVGFVKARIRIIFEELGKINKNHDQEGKYLALFGTSVPQNGYSGCYHYMDVYDIILTGNMNSFGTHPKASLEHTYLSGDYSHLQRGQRRYYNMGHTHLPPNPNDLSTCPTYMLDMGIGQVSKAFPDGIIKPALLLDYDLKSLESQIMASIHGLEKTAKCQIL